jgi:hypothetical protein
MKRLLISAFLMSLPALGALAADVEGKYVVFGMGTLSCGSYTQARKVPGPTELQFEYWVTGYITAVNRFLPETSDIANGTDLDGLMGWLDNWCRDNPTKNFSTGADALELHLFPTRRERGLGNL